MANVQASTLGLKQVRLLQDLPQERLEILAARCNWRRVEPGQVIVARNSPDRDVHFVVSGRVRVTSFSAGGKQVTFRDEDAGEMFGDLAAIDARPRSADVLALDSVLVASLTPEHFRELIATEPLVQERVLQRLAGLVRLLSERVIELSTLGVQNRIHAELLRIARQAGQPGNRVRIDPAPKHADIASQVSTYREQVTREFSALAKQGLLEKDGTALVLTDVARLERIVAEVRLEA
ncbi:MAG TPA: Crp/Fnr family transcriptional regulator [Ramlibacter sp.]|nr:Crp/Fnr family transcriptional regulator [Ramlibacter sp.]